MTKLAYTSKRQKYAYLASQHQKFAAQHHAATEEGRNREEPTPHDEGWIIDNQKSKAQHGFLARYYLFKLIQMGPSK